MSAEPKFQVGDDLFVRDPTRFLPGVVSITGPVQSISQLDDGTWAYTLTAYLARVGGGEPAPDGQGMRFAERDVGLRGGTPLSQLSGRPGHPGYERFKSIAASYGYD